MRKNASRSKLVRTTPAQSTDEATDISCEQSNRHVGLVFRLIDDEVGEQIKRKQQQMHHYRKQLVWLSKFDQNTNGTAVTTTTKKWQTLRQKIEIDAYSDPFHLTQKSSNLPQTDKKHKRCTQNHHNKTDSGQKTQNKKRDRQTHKTNCRKKWANQQAEMNKQTS